MQSLALHDDDSSLAYGMTHLSRDMLVPGAAQSCQIYVSPWRCPVLSNCSYSICQSEKETSSRQAKGTKARGKIGVEGKT